MSKPLETAACATCGAPLTSPYCAECGEKRFDHHSLSLKHFFEHAFEAFTHFDTTIFRTIRTLAASPGRLTADYVSGRRKPYLAPVQLFLVMNLLYFVMQAINGWNTLTTDLHTHMTGTHHREIAQQLVQRRIAAKGVSLDQYRTAFDAKAGIQAKSLIILMVPFFALAVWLLHIGLGRYLAEHLVFSVHFYAFFLLALSVMNTATTGVLKAFAAAGVHFDGGRVDVVASVLAISVFFLYLARALRTVYKQRWWLAALKAGLLVCAVVYVLYLYRFILLLVTLSST